MNKTKQMIWVTFQKKGLHLYPAAKDDLQLNDVRYLGNEHRHLFQFKVSIQIFHDDRDIEFHQFLNWLESLYETGSLQLNHFSCEMISDNLYTKITKKFPKRDIEIDISEDGECGSIIFYSRF